MIAVHSLSKKYRLYRSPADRLREIVVRKKFHTVHQALDNVSFVVNDGETLGIIGKNGAGKSTLLKVLTGILLPDSGSIAINGKITGLLELGTGFNAEMSGIENIFMNGTLLGMTREEIERKKDEIIGFAELGDFIYEQIKTYSSGMVMRLAFSVAIHADPRCFVVDEALSVGDAYFQQKCMRRITDFKRAGGSIIFVSHDMNAVKVLCDKAVLLDQGSIVEEGDPETVANAYNFLISKQSGQSGRPVVRNAGGCSSYGTLEARIKNVTIEGENSHSSVLCSGEYATIAVEMESDRDFSDLTVGILIRDKFGQDIFGTNSRHEKVPVAVSKARPVLCRFRMRMDLGPGKYTVTAALHSNITHLDDCFHWADNIASFEIAGHHDKLSIGVCKLYPAIEIVPKR